MNEDKLRCESMVYKVENDWFEYGVLLFRGWDLLDFWDSQFETYNGVPGQRLSFDEAREAAAEVREAVDNGDAYEWFDVPFAAQ